MIVGIAVVVLAMAVVFVDTTAVMAASDEGPPMVYVVLSRIAIICYLAYRWMP